MSQSYKGMTIPAYADTADGPAAFQAFVDAGPIPRFADATARNTAIPTPTTGMLSYNIGTGLFEAWNGSAWVSPFVTTSGFTMTGQINMNSQRILNVGTPAAGGDAMSRDYADARFAPLAHNQDAGTITTGTLATARVPNLDASKITSGTFGSARIPNLDASKITAGTLSFSRLPTGTSSAEVAIGNHNHNDTYYTEAETTDYFPIMYWGVTRRIDGPRISVNASAPSSPKAGDLWFDI